MRLYPIAFHSVMQALRVNCKDEEQELQVNPNGVLYARDGNLHDANQSMPQELVYAVCALVIKRFMQGHVHVSQPIWFMANFMLKTCRHHRHHRAQSDLYHPNYRRKHQRDD